MKFDECPSLFENAASLKSESLLPCFFGNGFGLRLTFNVLEIDLEVQCSGGLFTS